MVLFTLSSLWSIITACVSYSGWDRSRGSASASTWLSRSFCTTTQRIQLETELIDEHVREDDESNRQRLRLGLRDSQGSLLNRSWQVLTTSPDVQRVLNHRICDKKHKHGRLFNLSSESSLQLPKSMCQTLAKQFLVKNSWHSVLGILEHLHPDEDERPKNPSAVDREVDVPPQALPPPALPPPAPPVVDAGPNSSERKEITTWLQKGHQ